MYAANPVIPAVLILNEEISKTYSLDEIAKHNNRDDLWIIVKGKVYDH